MKTWLLIAGGGVLAYRREGGRTRYLGRYPLEALSNADVDFDELTKMRDGLREAKRSLPQAKPASGEAAGGLSFRKDGHTYWFLADAALRRFYLYVKGPSTRHKAKYLGRRSLTDVVNLAVSAGALHVVDALSRLVSRLEKALEKAAEELRRKAEEAAERLKRRVARLAERLYYAEPREAARRIAEEIKDSDEWPLVRRHRGVLAGFLLWLEEWSGGLVDRGMLAL